VGRFLIVDDEKMYREPLLFVLAHKGHEVKTASTGHEAVETGEQFFPHVLVADWRLTNDFSGLQVAEVLSHAVENLKVIMITGYSTEELRQESKVGIFRILEKPFDLDEFVVAAEDALVEAGLGA